MNRRSTAVVHETPDDAWMAAGVRCLARDAFGDWRPGVITYGPAWSRNGDVGSFVKVWVDFDHSEGHDEIPWPIEDVRPEAEETS